MTAPLRNFLVLHRVAVSGQRVGQGLGKKILQLAERLAVENGIYSVKLDTNFDNAPMLAVLDRCGYAYCGGSGGKRLGPDGV